MKVREVICKRWFLSKKTDAITLYPFIFYRISPSDTLRSHEWIHVDQIRRLGWLKFYFLYLWYSLCYGYRNNPFEKEAYDNQHA